MAAVYQAANFPQADPTVDRARETCRNLGIALILAGTAGCVSFWAVYYLGLFLAIGAIVTGSIQIGHTKSHAHMMSNHSCGSPLSIFNTLTVMNGIGVICSGIGVTIAIIAIIIITGDTYIYTTTWVIFAIVAAIADVCIGICALASVFQLRIIHTAMQGTLGGYVAAGSTVIVTGGGYQQQAVYGQPQQYGAPQQQYSQYPVQGQPTQGYGTVSKEQPPTPQ